MLGATLFDDTTTLKQTVKRQTKMPTLRKIKRAAKPPTSRPTFAAHFILPNRTTSTRQHFTKLTNFSIHLPREKSFDTHI